MTQAKASREDPAWYSPIDLPEEVLALDRSIRDGLGVGAAGKVGLLELSFAPFDGVTRLRRHYQRAPLHIYRPIYLDAAQPDMAFVFLLQSGDGLVQGDRYRVDIDCEPRAAVHVTTQAATNVFGARQNLVTQLVNLHADAGAVLEYLPDPVVPFRRSRLFQRISLTADREATVILGETVLPGRVAYDETHAYDLYWSETEVRRPDGTLLFSDLLRFKPADGEQPRSIGQLGGHDVVATLYLISGRMDPTTMVSGLRRALDSCPDVLAGVSELPDGCGAAVRLLGSTSQTVQAARNAAWNAARLALLGIPAPDRRKGDGWCPPRNGVSSG
jgi:urease accessory protein